MKTATRTVIFAASMFCAWAVAACATLEQLAPPVDDALLARIGPGRAPIQQIEHGREIYITSCADCHRPVRVTRYTPGRWDEILPRMAAKSSLSEPEIAALRAYIDALLGTM